MSGPEQRVGGLVADIRARVIAEVLARHGTMQPRIGSGRARCACGWEAEADEGHRDHVAAAVAAALPTPAPEAPAGEDAGLTADAWDEGFEAAVEWVEATGRPGPNGPIDPPLNPHDTAASQVNTPSVFTTIHGRDCSPGHPCLAPGCTGAQREAADQATLAAAWDEGFKAAMCPIHTQREAADRNPYHGGGRP